MASPDSSAVIKKAEEAPVTRTEFDELVLKLDELYEWARRGQLW